MSGRVVGRPACAPACLCPRQTGQHRQAPGGFDTGFDDFDTRSLCRGTRCYSTQASTQASTQVAGLTELRGNAMNEVNRRSGFSVPTCFFSIHTLYFSHERKLHTSYLLTSPGMRMSLSLMNSFNFSGMLISSLLSSEITPVFSNSSYFSTPIQSLAY